MKKNKTQHLILVILLLIAGNSFSQTPLYHIKGTIVDKNNDTPIEGASVLILDLKNNLIITRIQTGQEGQFEISFEKGKYHISFSSEKYETLMKPIKYSDFEDKLHSIGNIQLEPLAYTELDEVMITAKDFRIENGRGKKTYHIGNSLKDVAGSMSNLLSYMPSVSVDIDGKVQLRGKEPIIQINGRKSNLSKSDALQMLPSDMVKKIEIIRSPSAREGETEPIINIITDKKRKGLIGGVNLAIGAPSTQKGGLHLALNKKKFNGYALYGIKNENGIKSFTNEFLETTSGIGGYSETENSTNKINSFNHFGEIQYEYLPNERSELVGSLSIYKDDNELSYTGSRLIEDNSIVFDEINQQSDNQKETLSISKEIEYELRFNEDNDLFKAEFEYEYEERDKSEKFFENLSSQTQTTNTNSLDKFKGDEIKLKLRYDTTLKNDAYFTVGYRLDRNVINQDQTFETNNLQSVLLSNNVKFTQYDNTGFIDYSDEFKGIYYSLGLRLKNTNRVLKDFSTNEESTRSFLNLLPIVNLSYEYGDSNEISFNYYSLLSQPRLNFLNSFNTSVDQQRIRIGNPDLDPQLTHAFELEYFKEFENSSLSTTLYSNFTKDIIQYVSVFNDETNITISRPENIGKANTYGVDFSYSLNSPRWLNTIIKLNGKYGTISNNETDSDEFYAFNTSLINIIRLKSYKLELSWFYNAPRRINFQIEEESNQYFKLGLSRRILKNKGNLVLSVIDPFNSGRRIQNINGSNFNYRNEFDPNQRRIFLSLFLRFSSKSKFRKTEKRVKEKGILQ
nr:outer membrane beta-barrel family protein [uncultured Psychroserpens sp.]